MKLEIKDTIDNYQKLQDYISKKKLSEFDVYVSKSDHKILIECNDINTHKKLKEYLNA